MAYLDTNTTLTAGTDLFEGPCPELADPLSPALVVGVTHYASVASDDYTMGASLSVPGSELESFQVMTRATTRAAAITRANEMHALLDNAQGLSLSGRTYFRIESDGPPNFLAQDQNLRWKYIANYHARKTRG